jgi:arginyl-tRNA synthetase
MDTKIAQIVHQLFGVEIDVQLSRPDPQFGDYATNIALQLAKTVGEPPRAIAQQLAEKLQETGEFQDVTVAGPGFINIRVTDEVLLTQMKREPAAFLTGQTIVAEYSDPNPFKVLHAGHLYTTLVGDVMTRLLAVSGAEVHRVNFGGDVGLHVAKNMWAIVRYLGGENPHKLADVSDDPHKRASWLSARYVEGNTAYEEDEAVKQEIVTINKRVYQLHTDDDHDSDFAKIYWTCRQWSYDYFNVLYDELEVLPFEKYYPESQTAPVGLETVRRELKNGVYKESDDAVVFDGDKYGLHTRVFINSAGLPTYEAKDVGLIMQKWADYHFDQSFVITGNDIIEYMKVVQKSIEQFEPELVKRSRHITHGNVKLTGGQKMSSRRGNVLLALDILDAASTAQAAMNDGQLNKAVMLGAVKFAFLKAKVGGDIVYDPAESVSLHGNSGPYLQYAHARARRILEKVDSVTMPITVHEEDRLLVRKLGEYSEIVELAAKTLEPHHVCNYLFELAQEFNRYYEKNQVIGSQYEQHRTGLVAVYADTLRAGLMILGIAAPDKM